MLYDTAEWKRRDLKTPEDYVKVLIRAPSSTELSRREYWGGDLVEEPLDGIDVVKLYPDPPRSTKNPSVVLLAKHVHGKWVDELAPPPE
jgi:hypothetical protein